MSCTLQIPLSEWDEWKHLNQAEEGCWHGTVTCKLSRAGVQPRKNGAQFCQCVKGRARDDPHRRRSGEPLGLSVVRVDFFFMKTSAQGDETVPCVAACDVETGYGVVSVVMKKGPQDKHAVRVILQLLEELGCSSGVILQSDAEAAATELVRAVASSRPGKTIVRQCPVASHGSNGTVERFIQSVQGLARTLRAGFAQQTEMELPATAQLSTWLIRHAAWVVTRYQKHADGRTSYQRVHNVPYSSVICEFGEHVMARKPGDVRQKFQENWFDGIWLGRSSGSDEHYIGTRDGLKRARTIKRHDPCSRWNAALLRIAVGSVLHRHVWIK